MIKKVELQQNQAIETDEIMVAEIGPGNHSLKL
jgi:hypothetical protein